MKRFCPISLCAILLLAGCRMLPGAPASPVGSTSVVSGGRTTEVVPISPPTDVLSSSTESQLLATFTPLPPLPVSPSPAQAETAAPEVIPIPTSLPLPRALPEEAILILSPGPGSRLTHPIHVSGISNPTFEQNLAVQIISADGRQLALTTTTIQAEPGSRGPFGVDMGVQVSEVTPAFIQVYANNPRDGGITHLSTVSVILAPGGAPDLKPAATHLEQIVIDSPIQGETLSGGSIRVVGFGLASFEQTLVVDVVGPDGVLVGTQSLIVKAPDLGQPGPYQVQVTYRLAAPGPGRILVRDPSAVFNGSAHVSSVEVNLEP